MSYLVRVQWKKGDDDAFIDNKYGRVHKWIFDGGVEVPASASPHAVPLPMSSEQAVDPEEAFVASLSSCHMLWFLSIAAGKGIVVKSYEDAAEGVLGKDADGKLAMTRVTLKPEVEFGAAAVPSRSEIDGMHETAHEKCFIANSVKTKITIIQS